MLNPGVALISGVRVFILHFQGIIKIGFMFEIACLKKETVNDSRKCNDLIFEKFDENPFLIKFKGKEYQVGEGTPLFTVVFHKEIPCPP